MRLGWMLLMLLLALPLRASELPAALQGWTAWVLHGEEYRLCPFDANREPGDPSVHLCAIPGEQRIRIEGDVAFIEGSWQISAPDQRVPLVYADDAWPEQLSVDGQAAAIESHNGQPVARLEAGRRELRYRLAFANRPESLVVSPGIARLALSLDGRAVHPLERNYDRLWLGARSTAAPEADALSLDVYRLLTDGLPQVLETRLKLQVAGAAREATLGPVWPQGFELLAVDSALPLALESGRRIRVQLQAGTFEIKLRTRATAMQESFRSEAPAQDWPAQEVWSFASTSRLRSAVLSGGTPVDPQQAFVPEEWRSLPAFAISGEDTLSLRVQARGLADDHNRLHLSRQLWLDFDGAAYTARDQLQGQLRRDFRLEMATPYVLESASEHGQSLLVTQGSSADRRAVELRAAETSVEAQARLAAGGDLPAIGWVQDVESLDITLNAPPGYRLLAAPGSDRAEGAWISEWSLWSVFLLAIGSLLAWRVGGWQLAAGVVGVLLLSHAELDAPQHSLLALLLLLLALRWLPASRWRSLMQAVCGLTALVLLGWSVPYALLQMRYALHPQLADNQIAGQWSANLRSAGAEPQDQFEDNVQPVMEMPAPAPPAPPPPPPESGPYEYDQRKSAELNQVLLQGSRVRANQVMNRYAKGAVMQAGSGRPEWNWRGYRLAFDGPVAADQSVSLWWSPPWLTALWRVANVLLLGYVLWLLGRELRARWRASVVPLASVGLLLMALGAPLGAQTLPTPELLQELKSRLTEAPACAPNCGRISDASLRVEADSLRLELGLEAGAQVLLPIPALDGNLRLSGLSLNGAPAEFLSRQGDGDDAQHRIAVPAGVHRLVLLARIEGERLSIRFPSAPARIDVAAAGWSLSGWRDARLISDRLELQREAGDADTRLGADTPAPRAKPFVQVLRQFSLDLDWTLTTTVTRVAPAEGGIELMLPLIPGEQLIDRQFEIRDGKVAVALQPGEWSLSYASRLEPVEQLSLTAAGLEQWSEEWRIAANPMWSLRLSGLPVSAPESLDPAFWEHQFLPLPGETLTLDVSRPASVQGASIAIDGVELHSTVGTRLVTQGLNLRLRATQGGQHRLVLPAGAELLSVKKDGSDLPLRLIDGALHLPIAPGEQSFQLSWREAAELGLRAQTPAIDLGLPAANIRLGMSVPDSRWILFLSGPSMGPAVLYWPSLVVLLALAWLLQRSGRVDLRPSDCWLLALTYSFVFWWGFVLLALMFLALRWRREVDASDWSWWRFDLMQLLIGGLCVAGFITLLAAIPNGLLGQPDMRIAGIDYYQPLTWFADRSEGALPQAGLWSLPIWLYRALMLGFALWLASALLRWLRVSWTALIHGGGWRAPPPRPPQLDGGRRPVFHAAQAAAAADSAPAAGDPRAAPESDAKQVDP